ncbi:hypothetical protein [Granulicella sp. L60]|nr:hypothetical protein [Granulicella sp. L60]
MRYQQPTLSPLELASKLITHTNGGNKNTHHCPDGGDAKSAGAYEVDE